MRIKIKFGGATVASSSTLTSTTNQHKKQKRSRYVEAEEDEDEDEDAKFEDAEEGEEDEYNGRKRKPSKKDSKAPRPYLYQSQQPKKSHYGKNSRHTGGDLSAGEWEQDDDDLVYEGRSRSHPASTTTTKSKRLPGSFFSSAALRDSAFAIASNPNQKRRSSSRVAYAFGTRVPEAALMNEREFTLFGGVDLRTDPLEIPLEQLARIRAMEGVDDDEAAMEVQRRSGIGAVLVNGVVVPASSYAAFLSSPPGMARDSR